MLTDCSSIQGSTASSSSDVMTLATSSSWCAISIPSSASAAAAAAASTRLRILRLIRPHARRILVTPDTSPSFGFAVRGGKEFGTGFFVSNVERSSEAELKGMRVGDQILRINGFRVDDAIHRELIQFITNQDRITMKVRSVGMLPIKEKDTDKLSWHAVKTFTNGSSASSESSYKTLPERERERERDARSKDVNITLNVAPRTKLGLGICKGPEWKPGIFVQFTKEKSVAREAGLRQGDQILSVNSIDFSDVLFSEAVAVMKSASKLEMIVRTAAGCDLFPGESSGYNSSASSVTGDQSPCWADAKSKRLTSVREEPTTAAPCWNESAFVEQQRRVEQQGGNSKQRKDAQEKKVVASQLQVNKTIIKLSDQGTSINNTFVSNTSSVGSGRSTNEYGTPKVRKAVGSHEAQPPPTLPTNATSSNSSAYASRGERETKTVTVEVHRQEADEARRQQQLQLQQQQTQQLQEQRAGMNSHHRHNALQPTHSMSNHTNATKQSEFQKCLRVNNCNQQQQQQQGQPHKLQLQKQQQQQQGAAHGRSTCQVDGSSLSSAITEELKKRKEKQRINAATASNNNNNNHIGHPNTNSHSNYMNISSKQNNYSQGRQQQQQQQQQHSHHHHQHHALSHCHPTPLSPSSSSLSLSAIPTTPTNASVPSVTLSARATSNSVNCSERNNHSHNNGNNHNSGSCSKGASAAGSSTVAGIGVGVGVGAGDQHSALMDEFKRAHQRMFKNGFQETERKERQEALRNTIIMEDDVNHRASRAFRNDNGLTTNGAQFQIPPPPPQFASSPPRTQQTQCNGANNKFLHETQLQQKPINSYNNSMSALKPPTEQPPQPPATPLPDYDNVEIRTKATTISSSVRPSYGYASTNIVTTNGRDAANENSNNNNNNSNRRTLRAGTITIGEYEQPQPRREPAKFDFMGTPKRNSDATDICVDDLQAELQSTLTRSKLKKSAEPLDHQSHCPLRNNYENYENVARKLHGVSINEVTTMAPTPKMSNGGTNGGTNGILKNGNRHSGSTNGTKSSDRTITFGN